MRENCETHDSDLEAGAYKFNDDFLAKYLPKMLTTPPFSAKNNSTHHEEIGISKIISLAGLLNLIVSILLFIINVIVGWFI